MCGIVGELAFDQQASGAIPALVERMARRGPDGEGLWTDGRGCTFGFRRLAVLDLSSAADQPMRTPDDRYALVFNGEVYNYRELRLELGREGVVTRSSGDTEVVLHALAHWGVAALRRFNGMFALAFYDSVQRRILLARDHAGIKPLYYLHGAQGVVFASQFDQILAHPWRRGLRICPDGLALYLRLGYIPAPYAMLDTVYMLEPGAWIQIDHTGRTRVGRFFQFPQYSAPDLSGEAACEAVDAAIAEAVRRQMVSDVPLGAFLSGGIDSPLVVAKMVAAQNANGRHPVRAITIGTPGSAHDESADAVRYARALGVEHTIANIRPDESLLNDAVAACGEPFADYSIFPTLLAARAARERVKVMLSGDGGDELFWGYVGRFASVMMSAQDFRYGLPVRSLQWAARKWLHVGEGYPNLRFKDLGMWYRAKHSRVPEAWLRQLFPDLPSWPHEFALFDFGDWEPDLTAQWLRWNEFVGHLTMVLLKVDRASMYHSLEVRVPLLDQAVIEVAARVDWRSCLDLERQQGKIPLRWALARHVPHQTQAKRGFEVPMGDWLRGPLRPLLEERLFARRELAGQPFDGQAFRALYEQHDAPAAFWTILSLALWEDRYLC